MPRRVRPCMAGLPLDLDGFAPDLGRRSANLSTVAEERIGPEEFLHVST